MSGAAGQFTFLDNTGQTRGAGAPAPGQFFQSSGGLPSQMYQQSGVYGNTGQSMYGPPSTMLGPIPPDQLSDRPQTVLNQPPVNFSVPFTSLDGSPPVSFANPNPAAPSAVPFTTLSPQTTTAAANVPQVRPTVISLDSYQKLIAENQQLKAEQDHPNKPKGNVPMALVVFMLIIFIVMIVMLMILAKKCNV